VKTIEASTLADWPAWLAQHHESESEVWVFFHQRHTGGQLIAYDDAVVEALCFGWIDSLIKRLAVTGGKDMISGGRANR
jgi:uncharacterized protein YdeI (YjbR/CyaY-like superfamily)